MFSGHYLIICIHRITLGLTLHLTLLIGRALNSHYRFVTLSPYLDEIFFSSSQTIILSPFIVRDMCTIRWRRRILGTYHYYFLIVVNNFIIRYFFHLIILNAVNSFILLMF